MLIVIRTAGSRECFYYRHRHGCGKTYLMVQLLRLLRARGLRCAAFKPICCGDRRDAELLFAANSEGLTIDEVNPLWLRNPLAPFAASPIENV